MTLALDPALGIPVVHVVDDEEVVREALAWLLRSRRLLAEDHPSADAFEDWRRARTAPFPDAPSCLLLDVRMPGSSGVELFERLVADGLTGVLPVIFLTGHGDVPTAVAAVKRGAFDFVEKPLSNNGLVDRIEQALTASAQALAARRDRCAFARALSELTEREREVMRLVALGRPNKLVADALDISVRTVEVHRARVFDKMGVRSAVELAHLLRDHDAAPGG
ncbi:MAG: response regulator transcription factor [Pseudomonadota bacterium]